MNGHWLSSDAVAQVELSFAEYREIVLDTWREYAMQGSAYSPPKVGLRDRLGQVFFAMPGKGPSSGAVGLKWIGTRDSKRVGTAKSADGLVVLSYFDKPGVVWVIAADHLTQLRTGAMACCALSLVGRTPLGELLVIGTGGVARAVVDCVVATMADVEKIWVCGRTEVGAREFCEAHFPNVARVGPISGFSVLERGVGGVVTATSSEVSVIRTPWVHPGCTVVVLDGPGKEMGVLSRCDRILVDDAALLDTPEGCRRFGGPVPEVAGSLGAVVTGSIVGRRHDTETVGVVAFGMGASDVAVAERLVARASARGLGGNFRL